MTRTMLLAGAALSGLAFVSTTSPILAQTPPDQLVIALNMSSMRGLDPQELNQFEAAEVVANLYDRLVTLPADDITQVEPMLATEWDVSEDGRTFTFTLREGVTFHSGNPLTARDAEYSLRRLVKMGLAPARDLTQWGLTADNVDQMIRAEDDTTLIVELPEVWNSQLVLYSLASFSASIVDSELVEENARDGDYGTSFLQTSDAGSGPYTLRTWRANDILIAEAFDDYWDGAPAMRRVLMRNVPESSSQRLQIQAGDIDIATRLSSSDLQALAANEDVTIQTTPGVGFYYIALNQQNEILANPQVREAFRYLVDYEGLSNTVMQYYGDVQQTIVPQGMPGALPDERPYSLDPDRARELIAEAGYPDGFSLTYYATPVTPEYEIAQSIQANAAEAGITLNLQSGDHIGAFRSRDYELFSARTGDRMPDPHAVFASYAVNPDNSQEANSSGLMAWRAAWDVPLEMQNLVEEAAHELDADRRAEIYTELNRMYLESSPPLITSFQRTDARAIRAEVQGYQGSTTWITSWDEVTKSEN
ncbi:ABC transporter substrate-binding protein [Pseudoroseicyclus aestuarii]|uniref:Peptide/nickel transport system substrate-binding protein n=1 Tax=Pseudoroseicyclus aestuarii TaxID=1795041 RepID=A0A318SM36_9RHOB|nr:ABC transporter substrate-binding protein [Pseudoroseicyclus aestuarii]PYE80591.1 peptide/nickel transport system substrate-binding protein [Pseudoroseicyclus aestuarii]